jgi:diguanylate cyclase (GGDEF)-like protein
VDNTRSSALNYDRTIKVLLVEDNPGDARLVQELLAETSLTSFQLNTVGRLGDAMESLREERCDVILLDLSLPDAQGLGTVDEVHSIFPSIPIVVLSGQSDEALAIQAVQGGAQDYLVKGQGDGNLLARALRYAIERKQTEERLTYLAQYDPLTGLANRSLFRDRLTQALTRASRDGHQVALMFLDLDHFKAVNDTYGHDTGDMLLTAVAKRLKSCVRASDTVARLGGDEFTVLLEGISSSQAAATVAQKILNRLMLPFNLASHEIYVTTSVGITLYPADGDNTENLLRCADMAMYQAKDFGRNNFQFFTDRMTARAHERPALRQDLRRALERNEFLLYYQPIFDLRTETILGVEALLRWEHPELGIVPPVRFLPLAEETEVIIPIGEWVLQSACEQVQKWNTNCAQPLFIAVNLSPRQFTHRSLPAQVRTALDQTGLEPEHLMLDLDEGCLLRGTEAVSTKLQVLSDMGVRVAVDDFGVGFSSIQLLRRAPLEVLKIDRSFIKEIEQDSDGREMIEALLGLAAGLHLEVIAEGVETRGQLRILQQEGCPMAQGFLLGKPVNAQAIEERLQKPQFTLAPAG